MMKYFLSVSRVFAGLCAVLSLTDVASAQSFTAIKGDLLLGFRKTTGGTYELVVNIGNVTNFLSVSPGTSININNYSTGQLSAAFSSYNNLQWSVSSAFAGSSAWASFPASTIWSTVPRTSVAIQTQPPVRESVSAQQNAKTRVYGVGSGATTISVGLGTTNSNNNLYLVREPSGDSSALTAYIGDPSDATVGDFQGYWYIVENVTPGSFTAAQRSDLYQSCPDGTTDPTTHLTTGNAYYIGYFQFNTNGTMSFTRATTAPPATTLTYQRSGNTSTISFPTTSGATYTLFYTNIAGIGSPLSSWATSTTNIVGDGTVQYFQDSAATTGRVYSVGTH
jgi:hypothetical protein